MYSLLRLVLFLVCAALFALVGTGWLLAVILGAVVAALLSYLMLSGSRERSARWLQARAEAHDDRPTLSRRAREDATIEDAVVDAAGDDPATGVGRASGPA